MIIEAPTHLYSVKCSIVLEKIPSTTIIFLTGEQGATAPKSRDNVMLAARGLALDEGLCGQEG